MRASDIEKSSGGESGNYTGIVTGETIIMYAPDITYASDGTDARSRLDSAEGMIIETPLGQETFVPRSRNHLLPNTMDYYVRYGDTEFIDYVANPSGFNVDADAYIRHVIDFTTNLQRSEADYGTFESIVGLCTDERKFSYLFMTYNDPVLPGINKRLVIGHLSTDHDGTDGYTTVYVMPNDYCVSTYMPPQALSVGGKTYFAFFAKGLNIYDPRRGILTRVGGLWREYPRTTTAGLDIRPDTFRTILVNGRDKKEPIQEINGVFVADLFCRPRAGMDQTQNNALFFSTDLVEWEMINKDHFTDNTHPGYLGSSYFIHCYFKDEVNNRLCAVIRSNTAIAEFRVYYTEDGTTWTRGITLRNDWAQQTWVNDSSDANLHLGDDIISTVDTCGEVIYENGFFYMGWINRTRNTANIRKIAMSRFSDYTLAGQATLEHIESTMETRPCLTKWNTSGPPNIEERSQCAFGFTRYGNNLISFYRIPDDEYFLSEWYYGGSDSVRWNSFDNHINLHDNSHSTFANKPVYIFDDQMQTLWDAANTAVAGDINLDVTPLALFEYTPALAECYSGGAADVTLFNVYRNTFKVSSATHTDFLAHTGDVKGFIGINYRRGKPIMAFGNNFSLRAIPGYDASWDTVLPVTRVD